METKIIVHTGAEPGTPLAEERQIIEAAPGVELHLRGRCNTPQKVLDAVRDADVALCYGEPYTREVFAGAPKLKAVVRYGIGVDTIDLDAATEFGVMAVNFPDFCIEEVANHALVLLLCCAKKIVWLDRALRQKGWGASKAIQSPMGPIHGETLGLIAFGNIARALAARAQCMGMEVIAYDPYVEQAAFDAQHVQKVTLEELAARSDYVSCHLPLLPQTRGLIGASFFAKMKASAYFINTSRGAVINEADLIAALQEKRIAGAGLDVFESEPIGTEHPFLKMDNVALTPHSASWADATFHALFRRIGNAVLAVLRGELPDHVANPKVLEHRRH